MGESLSTTLTVTTVLMTRAGTGECPQIVRSDLPTDLTRYYWTGTKWYWDESINLLDCNAV